ncbi:MAG: ribosome-associated translation inhibitor RaiA [Verrucomicrobiales bacterium]|nr:ribosome-associated translation inhibitor RaiA [Verrucomicrobiales bacterium]
MNIKFRVRGLNAHANLRRWLEQQLERLQSLIPVTSAEVVLDHQRDAAPAFGAHVHLAVPGPDIHATAHGHTMQAAWLKVFKNLKGQIERRKTKQVTRAKTNRQHPALTSRWSGVSATSRA